MGRVKSWVLAMLAPKRGLRVAPVPPKTADLTRPRPWPPAWLQVGTEEQALQSSQGTSEGARSALAVGTVPRLQSLTQWWVRLKNASHTEMRIVPSR